MRKRLVVKLGKNFDLEFDAPYRISQDVRGLPVFEGYDTCSLTNPYGLAFVAKRHETTKLGRESIVMTFCAKSEGLYCLQPHTLNGNPMQLTLPSIEFEITVER